MRRGATIIDDWIAEAEERGERRGELRGSINAARRVTRDTVELRFGELPPALAARIEAAMQTRVWSCSGEYFALSH